MATSKLQRLFGNMLDRRLPEYKIRENYRPDGRIIKNIAKLIIMCNKEGFQILGDEVADYIEKNKEEVLQKVKFIRNSKQKKTN